MAETPSDYVRRHDLPRKYGIGAVIVVIMGLVSLVLGDPAALVTFKVMVAIAFAIAWICLPQIYDPARSRTPFTPSFIERTALEGVLVALAIAVSSWSPEQDALRLVSVTIFAAVVYFGAQSIHRRVRRG